MAIEYQGALEVKIVAPESDVLNVDLKGENVLRNVDYLNELGNTYLKFGLDQKNQSAVNTLTFIRSQISSVPTPSASPVIAIPTSAPAIKSSTSPPKAPWSFKMWKTSTKQENLLKLKIDYYGGLNRHLNDSDSLKSFVAPPLGDPDPDLSANVQRLASLYSQRAALALSVQPKNPRMIAVGDDIALTQNLIQNNIGSHLAATRDQITSLELQKQENNNRLTNIPATERSFLDIKRGFDVNSTLYNFCCRNAPKPASPSHPTTPTRRSSTPQPSPLRAPSG